DLTNVVNENAAPGTLVISEVAPWSSGNSPVQADWFEVTNLGSTTVNIAGWKIDDNSYSGGSAVPLRGVVSIGPGRSAIFLEGVNATTDPNFATKDATLNQAFCQNWFGTNTPPAGVSIGNYGGSGVGLSTDPGDAVNLFNASNVQVVGVSFLVSPTASPFGTFDNSAGIGAATNPAPGISILSAVGVHGA